MNNFKLLVIGPSWVGDMVMAQALFKTILEQMPNSQIDVIAPSWCLDVTKRMPEINKGIISPVKHGELGIMKSFQLAEWLRPNKYDQAIILPRSWKSALIPWFSGIPRRTGYRGEARYILVNDMRSYSASILDQTVKKFVALGSLHNQIPDINYPTLSVSKGNQEKLIESIGMERSRPSIAIMPGAEYGPAKRWPANYFAKVIHHYLSLDWNVLILGSEKDCEVAFEIKKNMKEVPAENLYDITGKTSLEDVIDILAYSDIALTNDSGLMHIAAAVETPLLVLYGPTSPDLTPPLSTKARVLRKIKGYDSKRIGEGREGYHPSLLDLTPEEVLDDLHKLIDLHLEL